MTRCLPALLVALAVWGQAALARAEPPPPDAVAQLLSYNPASGNLPALLQAVVPKLAPLFLKLGSTQIQKGGPLSETLGPSILEKLDASPGSLPMVVYQKEEGRLPSAFIVARYKGVLPSQIVYRLGQRDYVVRHPLVAEYRELVPARDEDAPGWGPGTKRKVGTSFFAVNMPFGAGIFGLRPSFILGEWEYAVMPNGVAIASYVNRPARPEELGSLKTFKDKKGKDRTLDDDYFEGREYRLSHLLIPERDESGQVRNTVDVYFVRIVPALKPGTTLTGSGALARWIFANGAQDAVVLPVKLTREEIERQIAAAGKARK
jgi:hypothetical protein